MGISFMDRKEIVTFKEIDDLFQIYLDKMEEEFNSIHMDREKLDFYRFKASALRELKTKHTKEWEASMPPDPLMVFNKL